MKITIIGAGLSGLSAGYTLSKKGHTVTILEKENTLGGLASSFEINTEKIPLCYHHIMKTDKITRTLIKDLNLEHKLFNKKVKMGFYYNKKIHTLSEPWDLLFFTPLSPKSRVKFAYFAAKIMLKTNWQKEDQISAEKWIKEKTNAEILDKMFAPLLKIKFTKDSKKIAASWVGTRLKMRESSGPFGYLKGGIDTLIEKLKTEIESGGGTIITSANVTKLRHNRKTNKITELEYAHNNKTKKTKSDIYLFTAAPPILLKLTKLQKTYETRLKKIRYKSTICASIGLDKSYNKYYWTNFIDGNFTFGGILDHTKLNPYLKNASSMLYVFTYLDTSDKLWKQTDSQILKTYTSELKKIYPDIDKHILWHNIAKMKYSKPVYEIEYKDYCPNYKTPIRNLYLTGISTIYPKIRNMGSAIESGTKTGDLIDSEHNES